MAENIVQKLARERDLDDSSLLSLITSDRYGEELSSAADSVRRAVYGEDVFIRGLIEFTNYCRNDCFYCGIRAGNRNASRYRMTEDQIAECCEKGHSLGFRTFVLQGGEDPYFTDDVLCSVVSRIKEKFPGCAVTLSVGERSRESYKRLFEAGADRYLLRHETADDTHYAMIHPAGMDPENRKRCLFDLKEIGYQVGSGFMVGSPYQTAENIVADLRFLQKLDPDMIGIGPFVHHTDTPFASFGNGSAALTVKLISILRLMFPHALIPSTTSLGTVSPTGREDGLRAGANVVMPNLSPASVRGKYLLYDGKICTGEEAAECLACLGGRVRAAGYRIALDRGDVRR